MTDAIIRFTSRVSKKTVLITCGIAAFQHWVLNSSSKTRLTNPFDLGTINFDKRFTFEAFVHNMYISVGHVKPPCIFKITGIHNDFH